MIVLRIIIITLVNQLKASFNLNLDCKFYIIVCPAPVANLRSKYIENSDNSANVIRLLFEDILNK